jgi:hypothetical protein
LLPSQTFFNVDAKDWISVFSSRTSRSIVVAPRTGLVSPPTVANAQREAHASCSSELRATLPSVISMIPAQISMLLVLRDRGMGGGPPAAFWVVPS